ncbi:unnamed protein product [Leptosia nina]|uniref:Uncharacterized protein n=1 Tax=Leptosia nina TaxID=320188 RepID=A0AAV1JP89_9NEOP
MFKNIDCKEVFPEVERPVVSYVNSKHFVFFNMTSRRLNRKSPYYMSIHAHTKKVIDYNSIIHLHYYELLTNQYKPTFVEFHIKMCDLQKDELVIGASMVRALEAMLKSMPPAERPTNSTKCPYPPGIYHLVNVSSPRSILYKSFPFSRGRIFINVTMFQELALILQVDLVIRNL